MRCKMLLLFALLVLLAGFGAAVIPGVAAEEKEEVTGSLRGTEPGMNIAEESEVGILSEVPQRLYVIPQENFIFGLDWEPEKEITVTVEDGDPYTTTSDDQGYFYFPRGYIDVEAGDVVTAYDGETELTHTVTELELETVDRVENTVSGTAKKGTEVYVGVDDWAVLFVEEVTACEEEGIWEVDFGDKYGYEIHEGTLVETGQSDGGGFTYNYEPPAPYFNVYPDYNDIFIRYWSVDEDISITIFDEVMDEIDSFEVRSTEWGNYNLGDIEVDIKPGYTVEVHEGTVEFHVNETGTKKQHVVTALEITEIEQESNFVYGETDQEGWDVELFVWDDQDSAYLKVGVLDDGTWEANFDGEFEIAPGTSIEAWQADEERDTTAVREHVPHPLFMVDPESNTIWGHEWMCEAEITITVNGDTFNTNAGDVPWPEPECGDFYFHDDDLNLEPGTVVTVTDDVKELNHKVQYIEVTDVDVENDTVSGETDPEALVIVEIHDYDEPSREVEADKEGNWEATFDEGDIEAGVRGSADRFDDEEDYAWTRVHWHAPNPQFKVNPEHKEIFGDQWRPDTEITVVIYDDENDEIFHDDNVQTDARGNFDLWDIDVESIEAGYRVVVNDDETELEHTVRYLEIINVDVENDIVYGKAEEGSVVEVFIPYVANVEEIADEDGIWTAEFEEGEIAPGTSGFAEQWDEERNTATHIHWHFPNPWFRVDPYHNGIWGHDWPAGVMLDITIGEDPNDPDWEDQVGVNEWGDFGLWVGDDYDIKSGELVTVATEDKSIIKEHRVTNLRDIEVDVENDIVSGLADPFTEVEVHIHHPGDYHIGRSTVADAQGYWEVDFSVPGSKPHEQVEYDIGLGSAGIALQGDEEGDETCIHWDVQITANLYWQHDDGRLKVWHMEGHEQIGSSVINSASVDPAWQVKAVVDSDGDGHSDIYFYNQSEGLVKVWLMEGLEKVGKVEINNPAAHRDDIDPVWDMMTVYDLDSSGEPDIIWQALEGENEGDMAVWQMDDHKAYNTGRIHNHPGEYWVDPAWEIGAVFDLLGDGEPEIIWQAVGGDHEDDLAYWKVDMEEPFTRVKSDRIYNRPGDPSFDADWQLNASVDLFGDVIEEFIFHHVNDDLAYWQLDVDDPENVIRKDSGRLNPDSMEAPGWLLVGASKVILQQD